MRSRPQTLVPLGRLALLLACTALAPLAARANSATPNLCTFGPSGIPPSAHGLPLPGNGGFSLTTTAASFTSGSPLPLKLGGGAGVTFKGLLVYATAPGGATVGTWTPPPGYGSVSICPVGSTLGQTSNAAKGVPANFSWTAPADSTLPYVTFHTMVVVSLTQYYLLDTLHVQGPGNVLAVDGWAADPRLRLDAVRPTPFGSSAALDYTLPAEARVRLDVIDVGGRVVRHLESGLRASGAHHVEWDARDERGGAVGPGIYFIRLEAGRGVRIRRAVHLAG